MTNERYKKLMEDVGMPNSRSLLQALQQAVNETAQEVSKQCCELESNEINYLLKAISWHERCEDEMNKSRSESQKELSLKIIDKLQKLKLNLVS